MFTEPKEVCRRFFDEFINGGDFDTFDELVADDVIEHEELPGFSQDKAGVRASFQMMRAAFPDMRFEVERMVAEGDTVVIQSHFSGIHEAEFMGIPATGRALDVGVIDILRVANDRLAEHWGIMDSMSMMQQLGVLEEAPTASA